MMEMLQKLGVKGNTRGAGQQREAPSERGWRPRHMRLGFEPNQPCEELERRSIEFLA